MGGSLLCGYPPAGGYVVESSAYRERALFARTPALTIYALMHAGPEKGMEYGWYEEGVILEIANGSQLHLDATS